MNISIMGLGWFGKPLASLLMRDSHNVLGSTTSEIKKQSLSALGIKASVFSYPSLPEKELLDVDVIVLNIPPFPEQLGWFQKFNYQPGTWMIFISSTSTYPTPHSENAHLLKAQEDWVQNHFEKWTILRFGGLVGDDRHPGKYLSGKTNLPGRLWPVNLIHQEDCLHFTKMIIDKNIHQKIFNVVSDDHRGKEEFYQDYCQKLAIKKPEFDLNDFSTRDPVPNTDMKHLYFNFKLLH